MTSQRPELPVDIAATLVDGTAYADGRIFDCYRWLRANQPLGIASVPNYDPFWVVTRHADILKISQNNSLFLSGARGTTLSDQPTTARVMDITGTPHLVKSLVQMDGSEHRNYRALTQAWFMPGSIRKRDAAIAALADDAARGFAALAGPDGSGRCDFVQDVAMAYPLKVVMQILGVPDADYPRMLRLTQELFGPTDPDTARAVAAMSTADYLQMLMATVADFTAYFEAINADRRANPRDDLASLIANATIDGQPIGSFEAMGYYIIVATAGHDTTSSSTSAALWALATQPGLLDRIRADMTLVPALVEEAIRWATPVRTFMRSAADDTVIDGRAIAKGDWLMLCYGSGNRDEAVFAEPDRFDIDRKPNPQLAFGSGGHTCLGQHLARAEMRALFDRIIPMLGSVALDGEPKSVISTFVTGLKTLPIRFTLA